MVEVAINSFRQQIANCLNCNDDFVFNPGVSRGKYCSNACQQKLLKSLRYAKVKEVETLEGFSPGSAKRFAIEVWGHKCKICNKKTWLSKPIPLVLDHINGNSEDWSFLNLRLICCNCDAQTPTYKGKNRGNGRHARKLRYLAGKSY